MGTKRGVQMKTVTTKCPYCNKKGFRCEQSAIIRRARDSTVLFECENEHLFGRFT